jgi:hypothetical protein
VLLPLVRGETARLRFGFRLTNRNSGEACAVPGLSLAGTMAGSRSVAVVGLAY